MHLIKHINCTLTWGCWVLHISNQNFLDFGVVYKCAIIMCAKKLAICHIHIICVNLKKYMSYVVYCQVEKVNWSKFIKIWPLSLYKRMLILNNWYDSDLDIWGSWNFFTLPEPIFFHHLLSGLEFLHYVPKQ